MLPVPEHQTPAYKAAKLAVIILSTLIILALIALVVGGIRTLRGKTPASAPNVTASSVELPPGAQIVEMQSQPGRLILRIRKEGAEEIRIIDTQNGRLIGQVRGSVAPAR